MDANLNGNIFNHIPENLFSILAGPLKEVHAGLLLLIHDQYKRTIYTIPRETVIDLFCECLETATFSEQAVNELWDEAGSDEYEKEQSSSSALPEDIRERANHFLRKFIDARWVIQEQQQDYSLKITLPDYSLYLLETLDKIRTGYRMEFRGRVLSVYQNLTGEDSLSYIALQQAHESTAELIKGLTGLNHSIKKYTEKLLEIEKPRDIISQIFDEYQTKILGEQYYRLKTSEHISKYRTGILTRVKDWSVNRTEIKSQAVRMVEEKQAADHLVAENMIYGWLDYIEEAFRSMDDILLEIDRRNSQYARSAVEKLRFQIQQGRGIEQQLIGLLRHLAVRARDMGEQEELPPEVASSVRLFRQQVVDELSVRMPTQSWKKHQPPPIRVVEIAQVVRSSKLNRFKQRVRQEITVDEINSYVNDRLLNNRQSLPLSACPLETRAHWVRLIYILLYSRSKRAEFTLGGQRSSSVTLKGGKVELPDLTLYRKKQA
jgi:hypothetical protein